MLGRHKPLTFQKYSSITKSLFGQLCWDNFGGILLIFLPGDLKQMYIKVSVTNHFANMDVSYPTTVSKGILMFGVLNHLQHTNKNFKYGEGLQILF